ncbi:MAG: DUF763 domain-containing protein [Thermodesulfobacteriota bacterium]|nr:DUF763 domain-containing protein [Thermodesulfobacteriota bacterium]
MHTGIANLPLHNGQAPSWLFKRMTALASKIVILIVTEKGHNVLLEKLSDPYWFQAFGCILGFDWHSSGITTTACAAIKEGIRGIEKELGIYVAGGKGKTSRRTPQEIMRVGPYLKDDPEKLVYASRIAAKVDNNALQDGFKLYHHSFIFTSNGEWAVIQQGMNEDNRYARRYHWLSSKLKDFVCEPQKAVCSDIKTQPLNLVAKESADTRKVSTLISQLTPDKILGEINKLKTYNLPLRHHILINDINPKRLEKIFIKTYERQPEDFETLLAMQGVGPKTLRALSLISELIYGTKLSKKDPATYSFAHGGKDGHPFPVDRIIYDNSINILKDAIAKANIGRTDKINALRRLHKIFQD